MTAGCQLLAAGLLERPSPLLAEDVADGAFALDACVFEDLVTGIVRAPHTVSCSSTITPLIVGGICGMTHLTEN